ncbi:SET and MYND domain-containing protein 4-like [Macrobrachium rosenbergii]|uniref:SET and MYND domain-containing protein 4-like n=1 Tax=Macrobrachium rosenbergii TaxID=79674 RepID=UPI0034D75D7D
MKTFDVSDISEYTSIESPSDGGQKNLEEMFACVWDLEERLGSFPSTLVPSMKSEEKANKLQILGDRFYGEGKVEMALSLYNMSLMIAPHPRLNKDLASCVGQNEENNIFISPYVDPAKYGGTPEGECRALANGFARRAIMLFDLKLHDKSLDDIELALGYGCSEELCTKLVLMKEECQMTMNRLKYTTERTRGGNDDGQNLKLENAESPLASEDSRADYHISAFKTLLTYTPRPPPSLAEPSTSAPSLSSAVRVALTPSSGRGLIAKRDIYPGEVLAVDRAYSVGLDNEELSTYCLSCLRLCLTPLPCPGCSEVVFCSELCRQTGLSNEHWIECKILSTLVDMNVPSTYYPHKMLKSFTYSRVTDVFKKLQVEEHEQPQQLRGFSKEGVYSSSSYQAVRHLCTNKEKFSPEFLLRQCKYAYAFTKLLEMSGRFFISDDGEPLEYICRSDFITTGAVLLSHILMIHSNQFTISDQNKASKQIGSGLFLTASLVNHSCYQSTTRYMCGRDLILVARRPIQAGEEVTGTYTTDFSRRSLPMRRAILSKYHIDCNCTACEHQWPTYDHLPKFRCIECRQVATDKVEVCLSCRSKVLQCSSGEISLPDKEEIWRDTVQKIEQEVKKAMTVETKLKNGERISEVDYKSLCRCIETAHRYIGVPCQFICSLENTLLSCFYAL